MRILVVEDEVELATQIAKALEQAGYTVDTAHDGEQGGFLGDTEPYDAVILDLGLPKIDGLTVLDRWRQAGHTMPVLILTARETWSEKVSGFDKGADDYVTKPFNMEELLARLRALIRRSAGHAKSQLESGPVTLDTRSGKVTVNGVMVILTANELKVLSYLMHHPEKVVSRTELTEHIYDQNFDRDSNTIEVFIGRLRKKLGPDAIYTHRGRGYSLAQSAEDS
ncbi:MAG: response regulator transcription factor [Rhodospirillaceae bacterium]|nr:response regulator transcription factor [Rhodospirillaceae bacterium]